MKNKSLLLIISAVLMIILAVLIIFNSFFKNDVKVFKRYEEEMYEAVRKNIYKYRDDLGTDAIILDIESMDIKDIVNPYDHNDKCMKSYVELSKENTKDESFVYKVCLICNDYNPYGKECQIFKDK